MNKYYVGITIGPIIETLCMASRPASLWCASAMFSWLTEDICNKVKGIGGTIVSPYYPDKKAPSEYSVTAEGVGKYHDRIIFKIDVENEDELASKIEKIIAGAKLALANELVSAKLAEAVGQPDELLKNVIVNYLQVKYIIEECLENAEQNCILRLSPYLDAAELCPVFDVDQSLQPITTLFEGNNEDKHNELVKLCLGIENGKTPLITPEGKVRDIAQIAESVPNSDRKIFNYYAIVQSDGDSMGKLLGMKKHDEDVEDFSKKCLSYTSVVAEEIHKFGGVTIYAGGDDLLFISPLESIDGRTVFQLCSDIKKKFDAAFKGEKYIPTVSFGISINYKRFPLYEALSDALAMLRTAKKVQDDDEPKNKTAVHIRKGSGHSMKLRFLNGGELNKQLDKLINPDIDQKILNSMPYKIGLYRPIFTTALATGKDLEDAFENLFDSEYHGSVKTYIQTVKRALAEIYHYVSSHGDKDYALEMMFYDEYSEDEKKTSNSKEETAIDLLYSLLRVAKFYSEKKGVK